MNHSGTLRGTGFLGRFVAPATGLLIIVGLVVTVVGVGIAFGGGAFVVLWIGLAVFASGVVALLVALFLGIGIVHKNVLDEVLQTRGSEAREPLIDLPVDPGETTDLDDEETARVEAFLHQMGFAVSWPLLSSQKDMSAIALFQISSERLDRGDLRGAASAAVKSVFANSSAPQAWLALAAAHAKHGDRYAATKFLREANERASKRGFKKDFWEPQVHEVQSLLDSRQV